VDLTRRQRRRQRRRLAVVGGGGGNGSGGGDGDSGWRLPDTSSPVARILLLRFPTRIHIGALGRVRNVRKVRRGV